MGVDVLTRLERDPMECARELDWVAKLALLEGYRDRDGLDWGDHRLAPIDIQWSRRASGEGAVPPAAGRGRVEQLVSDEDVKQRRHDAAGGHPGLLPRALPGEVRRARSRPRRGTR